MSSLVFRHCSSCECLRRNFLFWACPTLSLPIFVFVFLINKKTVFTTCCFVCAQNRSSCCCMLMVPFRPVLCSVSHAAYQPVHSYLFQNQLRSISGPSTSWESYSICKPPAHFTNPFFLQNASGVESGSPAHSTHRVRFFFFFSCYVSASGCWNRTSLPAFRRTFAAGLGPFCSCE